MPQLRESEKSYFINRIHAIIDEAIQRVKDGNPHYEKNLKDKARKNVLTELGLTARFYKIEQAEATYKAAGEQLKQLREEFVVLLPDNAEVYKHWDTDTKIERGLGKLTDVEYQRLLNDTVVGTQLITLNAAKRRVKDAIMLATTTPQMAKLMDAVMKQYGSALSETERLALAIFNTGSTGDPEATVKAAIEKSSKAK
jgi:hypothetical protein